MTLNEIDRRLVAAVQDGLPLATRPYAEVARMLGLAEDEVIARLTALVAAGTIRRIGIVVRHRELGYRANAMVVWDVDDSIVAEVGRRVGRFPFVTLCYRRPRRLPAWPYNLFCMIHGRDRGVVEEQIEALSRDRGLAGAPRATLFSRARFKQCGARYATPVHAPALAPAAAAPRVAPEAPEVVVARAAPLVAAAE